MSKQLGGGALCGAMHQVKDFRKSTYIQWNLDLAGGFLTFFNTVLLRALGVGILSSSSYALHALRVVVLRGCTLRGLLALCDPCQQAPTPSPK